MRIVNFLLTLSLLATAGGAWAQTPAPAAAPLVRDAREQVPAGMLGIWKVDPALSKPSRPDMTQMRSFSLTQDGKLMVAFMSVDAAGKQSWGHWWLQVDGVTQGYEYRNDNGSTPIAVIQLRKVDQYTYDLTNTVAGVQASKTLYAFSPDFKTFTLTRAPGTPNAAVSVFRKWDGK
jgi:hypothetical protein